MMRGMLNPRVAACARAVAAAAALGLTLACRPSAEDIANGDDPMAALAQHVPSTRYPYAYWARVARTDAALWARASTFCRRPDAAQYPTCASVGAVGVVEAGARPAPRRPGVSLRVDVASGADSAARGAARDAARDSTP